MNPKIMPNGDIPPVTSEIGYFKNAGARDDNTAMLIQVQPFGEIAAKSTPTYFRNLAEPYAVYPGNHAAVILRLRPRSKTPFTQLSEASLTLTLDAAERLRDALAQAIARSRSLAEEIEKIR
jgi:hypothetical protein